MSTESSTETNTEWTQEDEVQLASIRLQQQAVACHADELQQQVNNMWLRKEAARKAERAPLTAYLKGIIASDAKKIENLGEKLADHATEIRRLLAPYDKQGGQS